MRNLGLEGVSLIGIRPLPRGTVLRIQILGYRSLPSFSVTGRVRWVDERKNGSGRSIYLTGVEFTHVAPIARRRLEFLLTENKCRRPAMRLPKISVGSRPPSTRLQAALA